MTEQERLLGEQAMRELGWNWKHKFEPSTSDKCAKCGHIYEHHNHFHSMEEAI